MLRTVPSPLCLKCPGNVFHFAALLAHVCVQVLFETDDLQTALWAELLATLLRFKRMPPYLTDHWNDGKNSKGNGHGEREQ